MKSKHLLLTLLLALLVPWAAQAQETLTVHDGTGTNRYVPFYGYYADEAQTNQMIYPATELGDMDGGTISGMTFYWTPGPSSYGGSGVGTWTISIGETTATSLNALDNTTALTEVFSGGLDALFNSTDHILTIAFDSPYNYNGGNLLVQFSHSASSYKDYAFYGETVQGASYCYNSQRNFLPKTTFTYEAAVSDCPKPSNFVATDVTAHTAVLSWESEGFAFLLQYKKASDSNWTQRWLDFDENPYTLTGLSGETEYQARVAAFHETCPTDPETGDNIASDWREISFPTLVSCPKPTNLTCSAYTTTTATFTWTNGGEETQWVLEYATSDDFSGATSVTIVQNDLTGGAYTLTGLTAEQTYYARINTDCGGEDGVSAWSNTCEFKPSAVQIVTIGSGSGVSNYFPTHPNWNYSYTQQIYTAAEIGVSGAITSISFKGNKNGTRSLVVYMANTSKEAFANVSDYIPIAEATQVFSGNVIFAANEWITIELEGDGFDYDGSNLAVIVDDNSSNYNMGTTNWATFNTTNYEAMYFYQDSGSPANIDPASPSAQYQSTRQEKNQIILNVLPTTTPKPRSLEVSNLTAYEATISWTAPAENVLRYYYQYGLTGGAMSEWVYTNETSVDLTGLTPSTDYTFNVYAEYAEGNSDIASIDFTTEATCPVPAGLAINNMVATWEAGTATQWNLQYRKSGTEEWTAVNGLTAATYDLSTLTLDPTTDYDVQVQADCGNDDLSVWSESVSFTTPCASYDIPYTYDFEDAAPFDCWTPITGVTRASSSSNAHNGSYYLRFAGTTSNLVALPQFNEPTNNLRVEFWTRPEGNTYSSCGTFSVGYMTDITDASTFVEVENYAYNDWTSNTHVKKTVDFNNAPANANIAFRHNAGSSSYYWYADDVTVKAIPSCFAPTDLAVANISTNSAELSWTANTNETEWTVYYKKTAAATYTEVANVTENPYTLEGLDASSNYEFYVVANCSTEEASEPSEVFAFTTACDAITNLPWSEDFDAYSATATSSSAPSGYPNDVMPSCWTFLNRSTSSSSYPQAFLSTYSAYAVSGNCLFFKSSSTTPIYAVLPEFAQDIAGLQLTFTYRNEGTSTSNGTLIVGYMTDPTDATTFETVLTCEQTTSKTEMEVTFAGAPAGSYIAFKYQGGTSNNFYLSIDNVVVEPAPTCIKPADLAQTHTNHSATLSWTAGNEGQNAWQIAYSTTSFNPNAAEFDLTTVEVIDVDDNTYTFDKTLEANTHYYMYVRGYCGDEDYSKWVGIDFTTGAAAPSPTITTVDEITPFTAVLRWTAAGGDFLESYDIYYSQTSGQPANDSLIQYTGVDAGFTSKILENLTEGYWYVYMRAYHGETDGYSSWTPYSGYGFQVPEACPEPTGLTAGNPTPNSITLTWTEGADWQYAWKVAYSTDPEFNPEDMDPETFVEVYGQQGPTITCTVTGLDPETTYYFRVLGNCNSPYGDSDWTNAVSETTLVACPLPTDLNVKVAQTSATLTWTGYSDSYTVEYRTAGGYDFELIEGFESGSLPAGWTIGGNTLNTWNVGAGDYSITTGAHSGNYNALITHNVDDYETFLITPVMENVTSLNLWYINRSWSSDTDEFGVYCWNGDNWIELFHTSEAHSTWTELNLDLTSLTGSYQIGFMHHDNYGYGVGLDDITIIGGEYHEPGEWITYNGNVTSTTATIEGLEFGTKYDARVKANCGEEYSDNVTFTTSALKVFTTEGAWEVADNWTPAGVPTIEEVVSIEAAATISQIAYADEITINGGSITIEDGGQLVHNNAGVTATVKKNIAGYTEANYETNNGYYFIANPLTTSVYPEEAGLITEGEYDLYDWAPTYSQEWRNYKDNEFSTLSYNNTPAYLYANMNNVELTFNGTVRSSLNKVNTSVHVTNNRFGAWNLIGNPFVCNAYLVDNSGVALPYYKMNAQGNGFEATTGEAIAPATGIFYEAPAYGQVYFTREAPATESSSEVIIVIEKGHSPVDNAIIRFGQGQQMSKFSFRENSSKVYIPMDGIDYAVVNAGQAGEMPVSFKAESNGTYSLNFTSQEVSFSYLHLIDNMTGADVNLLETPYYSFNAQTTDYANRFRLVFATGSSTSSDTFGFINGMGNLCIFGIEGEATLQVVDVLGHVVSSNQFSGSYEQKLNVAPGVYMLRLINGNDVKVQKMVIR